MNKTSSRFAHEEKTIRTMIGLYCRERHGRGKNLCPDCAALWDYALEKLEKCPWDDDKPVCSQCTVHCYIPARREQIRQVMRYAGPRLIKHHPLMALRHLLAIKFNRAPAGRPGKKPRKIADPREKARLGRS